jgi:hypothetical protein
VLLYLATDIDAGPFAARERWLREMRFLSATLFCLRIQR